MSDEVIRVRRVIDLIGPRSWVEQTLRKSVSGRMTFGGDYAVVEVSREEAKSTIIKYEREELNAPSSVETEPEYESRPENPVYQGG